MLGYRYLWVDLLCIDQNDAADKERKIAMMGQIFGNASLTLCKLDEDMFSRWPNLLEEPMYDHCSTTTMDQCYIYTNFRSRNEVLEGSDWASRAWTFQEGELSTRRLCFTSDAVFMVCKEEIFHDILELDQSSDRETSVVDFGGIHYLPLSFDLDADTWKFGSYARMVYSYATRSMTFRSDAHRALQGALQRISQCAGIKFAAAMPAEDIHNALLWQPHSAPYPRRSQVELGTAQFPSWSWLGWEGRILYNQWLQEPRPANLRSKGVYSLVDLRDIHDTLYYNAVRVRARAPIKFTDVSTTASHAVLVINTTTVSFRIALAQERQYARPAWHILDTDGQPVVQEFAFQHYGLNSHKLCSFPVHEATDKEMFDNEVDTHEFLMLQHWSSLKTVWPPVPYTRPLFAVPKTNLRFVDTVWAMAIKRRQEDGSVAEMVAVLCIPAKIWYAAKPERVIMRIV